MAAAHPKAVRQLPATRPCRNHFPLAGELGAARSCHSSQESMNNGMQVAQGQVTQYYQEVKTPIFAGMEFGTSNYKMRKVGYDVVRLYFDTPEMDWQVGRQRIKRIFNR